MFRIVTDVPVREQIDALPAGALPHYAQVLDVLELVPSSGRPYNEDKPAGPMRELTFGDHGEGTVTYLVLEEQAEVHVLVVLWFG